MLTEGRELIGGKRTSPGAVVVAGEYKGRFVPFDETEKGYEDGIW